MQLRENGLLWGLRINALVIVDDQAGAQETGELPAYFESQIIQGPGAFVEVARGFEDYDRAMRRKLLRELATQPLGALGEDRSKFPGRF